MSVGNLVLTLVASLVGLLGAGFITYLLARLAKTEAAFDVQSEVVKRQDKMIAKAEMSAEINVAAMKAARAILEQERRAGKP